MTKAETANIDLLVDVFPVKNLQQVTRKESIVDKTPLMALFCCYLVVFFLQLLFLTSNFQSMATAYPPVYTTNLKIPTYFLHSSSHPSHVKNFIPFSQFLRLRRSYTDDSDFSNKSEEMRHFFKKRDYPDSVVNAAQHRVQQIDRQSALQTSQNEKNERIPFTLTSHPRNLAAKTLA